MGPFLFFFVNEWPGASPLLLGVAPAETFAVLAGIGLGLHKNAFASCLTKDAWVVEAWVTTIVDHTETKSLGTRLTPLNLASHSTHPARAAAHSANPYVLCMERRGLSTSNLFMGHMAPVWSHIGPKALVIISQATDQNLHPLSTCLMVFDWAHKSQFG